LGHSDALKAKAQQPLLQAVEDLVALTGLIKMATTVPKAGRTKHKSSRINLRLPTSIFEEARTGTLVGEKLLRHITDNPNALSEQDPSSGLTPLAIAVAEGFPQEVKQLLKNGAKADAVCRDGETPLLLAAWKTVSERPLVIQHLLDSDMAPGSIDATCEAAENKTPLMFVIQKKDIDSIRMLRRAKASLSIKDNDGFNAKELAEGTDDPAVQRALYPDREPWQIAKFVAVVVGILGYIIAWVNTTFNNAISRATSGLAPMLDQDTDRVCAEPSPYVWSQSLRRSFSRMSIGPHPLAATDL
jgi:hypothetical protein